MTSEIPKDVFNKWTIVHVILMLCFNTNIAGTSMANPLLQSFLISKKEQMEVTIDKTQFFIHVYVQFRWNIFS